jgi:excisionase family DNA binding protein
MGPLMDQPMLLTLAEVAHILRCSPRAVPRLVEKGKLHAPTSLGQHKYLWHHAWVDELLEAIRQGEFDKLGLPREEAN